LLRTLRKPKKLLLSHPFRLLSIDRILPDGDGLTLVETARRSKLSASAKILVLTQRVEPESRVGAFTCDADDYLAKPFLPGEYVARMTRLLRYRYIDSGSWVELSSYAKLDHINQKLLVGGTLIHLTPAEAKLLNCFYQTGVCTYEYLMQMVGEGSGGEGLDVGRNRTEANVNGGLIDFVYDVDNSSDNLEAEVSPLYSQSEYSTTPSDSRPSYSIQHYTLSALKMLVHRLKKKIYAKSGYTLIKTVYGVGFGVR
jgi:DNA-binding response OmpR family regulator